MLTDERLDTCSRSKKQRTIPSFDKAFLPRANGASHRIRRPFNAGTFQCQKGPDPVAGGTVKLTSSCVTSKASNESEDGLIPCMRPWLAVTANFKTSAPAIDTKASTHRGPQTQTTWALDPPLFWPLTPPSCNLLLGRWGLHSLSFDWTELC